MYINRLNFCGSPIVGKNKKIKVNKQIIKVYC